MPHLTLEYSGNLVSLDTVKVLRDINRAVLASGQVVDPLDLKSRAIRQDDYLVGPAEEDPAPHAFVHVTLMLLEGRSPEAKQGLSRDIMTVLQAQVLPTTLRIQFSVEIRDMARASYGKAFRPANG